VRGREEELVTTAQALANEQASLDEQHREETEHWESWLPKERSDLELVKVQQQRQKQELCDREQQVQKQDKEYVVLCQRLSDQTEAVKRTVQDSLASLNSK
jgi:hypothetical protein